MATRSQTNINSKTRKSITGVRGVRFVRKSRRYVARIQVEGDMRVLGTFDTLVEAEKAYLEAAKFFHGEFIHKDLY